VPLPEHLRRFYTTRPLRFRTWNAQNHSDLRMDDPPLLWYPECSKLLSQPIVLVPGMLNINPGFETLQSLRVLVTPSFWYPECPKMVGQQTNSPSLRVGTRNAQYGSLSLKRLKSCTFHPRFGTQFARNGSWGLKRKRQYLVFFQFDQPLRVGTRSAQYGSFGLNCFISCVIH
jgi:hypothetical protein